MEPNAPPLTLFVCGGLNYHDFREASRALTGVYRSFPNIAKVIHGGGSGADELGHRWAIANNIEVEQRKPDTEKHGRLAIYALNEEMVNDADIVIAFWNGKSNGVEDAIIRGRSAKKIVHVVTVKY